MSVIGVVSALECEAKIVSTAVRRGESRAVLHELEQRVCGIGSENAKRAATVLIEQGADGLLSWGLAGALRAGLDAGMILLPSHVVDAHGARISVDEGWHRRALEVCSPQVELVVAPIIETDTVLAKIEQKRELGASTGASAADMESFSIADVAKRHGVPFLAVRSVVDSVEMSLPDFAISAVQPDGRSSWLALMCGCVRHPSSLAQLIALGAAFRKARAALRPVADRLVQTGLGFNGR